MGEDKHDRLEIDERFEHHVRAWRVKHVCWIVMLLLVAAALCGFLGPGPFSKTTVRGAGMEAEYERIARYHAPAYLRLKVPGGQEDLELSLPTVFLKEIELEHIKPEPKEMRLSGEKQTWIFARGEAASELMINYRPQESGNMRFRLEVKDAGALEIQQLILP